MKSIRSFLDALSDRLFSSTYQIRRIVILLAVLTVLAIASFGVYYYQDRFYRSQPTTQQASVSAAEKAVRDDPQNTEKRLHLADTYLAYRRFDDAVQQALQVKQVDPKNTGADLMIGVAYANEGKPSEAIAPLQTFIGSRKDEDMPGLDHQLQAALYYLGDSYLQMGQPQDAIQPLETTVKQVGTDADSIYKLGLAYEGVQRHEAALKAFYAATAFVPNYTEVYQAMAQIYQGQNMGVEANYATAMVAYSKKDYAKAFDMLALVNRAQPSFGPAFTGMGLTCEAQKNLPCALSSYQVAAQLDPNDITASQGVKRVQEELQR